MPRLRSQPDDIFFDIDPGETLLEAALRAGLPMTHVCGGHAKCSTCRVWVLEGLENCPERTGAEAEMAARLGLHPGIRLACQMRPKGGLTFRRLVLDETDLALTSQLHRRQPAKVGELQDVAVFFSDIQGFTSFSEALMPYDVMYLLNRYFAQMGEVIERNGGYIDKFIGDGMMALFGLDGDAAAPLRAVNAGLQCLTVIDRIKPFFKTMYDIDFEVRIGLHWGEAVIGTLGAPGHERLTAIGDAVNVASRAEQANKAAGTRFLVTESLFEQVKDQVEASDFIRVRLPGTTARQTLYEIARLLPAASAALTGQDNRETKRYAGRDWSRLMAEDTLPDGGQQIFEFADCDVAVLRRDGQLFAFNNACPHVHLPFFNRRENLDDPGQLRPDESRASSGELVCRWHNSRFDLATGEVISWCELLQPDGTSEGMEFLGDISKNKGPLRLYPLHVADGWVWIAFDR
ncbi:adenylate/guanylate cyclase domain-containing protein [Leisingera sp. ANG59]|uniref:adenylate/guanylate cyclase domain-containing protein n=1 Tax=Leisingera sp. ANG59 TaxID=2675221 RepID=UPI0015723489|nr:adenylate/guanylate cyclase domain-containing protein [Leisingera sp. ANG59]